MGQANSRRRNSQSPTAPASTAVSDPLPQEPPTSSSSETPEVTSEDSARPAKRSRRASLRRSILGLVPSSSSSSRLNKETLSATAGESSTSQSLRKRWRSSRRFSKAPTQLTDLAEPTTQESGGLSGDREVIESESGGTPIIEVAPGTQSSTHASRPPSPSATPRSATPSASDSKSASRTDKHQNEPSPAASGSSPQLSPPTHSDADIRRDVTEFLSGRRTEEPGTATENNTNPPRVEADPANLPQPAPRHITQPSTLVIVQGVVNTTDAPHAPTSSAPSAASHTPTPAAPRPSTVLPTASATPVPRRRASSVTDERRRSRLHSFIRPSSMLGRLTPDSSSQPSLAQSPESSTSHTAESSSTESSRTSETPASGPEAVTSSQPEATSPSRGLSPGSIDVLGTLLSVAAAATAASLLSPSLHHNNASEPNSSNDTTGSAASPARPLSPTPTAGLGALGGLGGLAGLGLSPPSAASAGTPQDGRDRIRNVWDSIRERVGLNPRTGGAPSERHGEDTTSPPDRNQRMRPGEMMLAEMARALNAGLGLAPGMDRRQASENGTTEPTSSHGPVAFPTSQGATGQLPPEGSFERFLVNLQTDLRTLLSTEEPVPATNEPSASDAAASNPDRAEMETSHADPEGAASTPSSQHSPQEPNPVRNDEPPALEEVAGSDDEFEEAVEEPAAEESTPQSSNRTPTPIPSSATLPLGQEERGEPETPPQAPRNVHDRPAINLWRLYRFEPIRADQAQEHALRTTQAHAAQAGGVAPSIVNPVTPAPVAESAASPPVAPSASVPPSSPSTAAPSNPADQGNAAPGHVIPVIVVGLQSVDVAEQDDPEGDIPMPPTAQPGAGSSTAFEAGPSGEDPLGSLGSATTPRGRAWPSRAANAFRSLRPGRRGSRSRRNQDGSGSRTFLIYVIGGYYPPNHHMVTGPDNLDSYEALWELAELLGQVKPPTATRTDIDNSGLQIIKASELPQYEQDGKISSNCTERCLVCLDDYEPDDNVRVMTCRHAFHKDCVDKWLQVGRNNCPACRTKGVSISEPRPSPPSETPA